MQRFLLFLILLLLPSLALADKKQKQYRILFVGNSYTFYNDLPSIIAGMAKSKGITTEIDRLLEGGATLQGHFHDEKADKVKHKISQGEYDVVILQDQSQIPAISPEDSIEGVKKWASLLPLAKQQKDATRLILFQTWGRGEGGVFDTEMQDQLTATYKKSAELAGAEVAPVGEAWRKWYADADRAKNMPLHAGDGSHPNLRGSYLAALVLYKTIYKLNPVQTANHIIVGDKKVSMPSKEGKLLKQCAFSATQGGKKSRK